MRRKITVPLLLALLLQSQVVFSKVSNRHVPDTIPTETTGDCLEVTNDSGYFLFVNSTVPVGAYCVDSCSDASSSSCSSMLEYGEGQSANAPSGSSLSIQYNVCAGIYGSYCQGYIGQLTLNVLNTTGAAEATLTDVSGGSGSLTSVDAGYSLTYNSTNDPCPLGSTVSSVQSYSTQPIYRGVNLAGCDFQTFQPPYACSAIYFATVGASTIRLPFSWVNLNPNLMPPGSINPPEDNSGAIDFTSSSASIYASLVTYLTDQGFKVIIDMHNYMRYNPSNPTEQSGSEYIIGGTGTYSLSVDQYASAWQSIATEFVNNPNVMFDLMNEPNNMSTQLILDNYNAAISVIRSVETARGVDPHLIHLEGNSYTCLATWATATGTDGLTSAQVFLPANIEDSGSNYVIHVHEYFTGNESGANPTGTCGSGEYEYCVDAGTVLSTENFSDFVTYLSDNGLRAFVGELNGAPNSNCIACINNFLQGVHDNAYDGSSGFIGWTAWAAGYGYTSPYLNLNPTYSGTTPIDPPQMSGAFMNYMTPP